MKNYNGFLPGSVVRLKSGGPRMTLVGGCSNPGPIFYDPKGDFVFCTWFDSGGTDCRSAVFTAECLVSAVDEDNEIPF